MWKIPLLLPYIIIQVSTRSDTINYQSSRTSSWTLKQWYQLSMWHLNVLPIATLLALSFWFCSIFLSLANGKIFKIVAKLVILVAILYSILDFQMHLNNGVKLTEMVLLIYIRKKYVRGIPDMNFFNVYARYTRFSYFVYLNDLWPR